MADKRFNIADILKSRGISLNIPPRKNDKQLSSRKLVETRRIASLRIHIKWKLNYLEYLIIFLTIGQDYLQKYFCM